MLCRAYKFLHFFSSSTPERNMHHFSFFNFHFLIVHSNFQNSCASPLHFPHIPDWNGFADFNHFSKTKKIFPLPFYENGHILDFKMPISSLSDLLFFIRGAIQDNDTNLDCSKCHCKFLSHSFLSILLNYYIPDWF